MSPSVRCSAAAVAASPWAPERRRGTRATVKSTTKSTTLSTTLSTTAANPALPTTTKTTTTTATSALPLGPAGMCFDASCQQAQDRAFVAAVLFPLAASAAAALYVWNQPPSRPTSSSPSSPSSPSASADSSREKAEGESAAAAASTAASASTASVVSFEDPSTGMVFEGDTPPERDRSGQLALRAFSFTPVPVEQGSPGERVRVDVGEVGGRSPRTYVFEKLLSSPHRPSKIVSVTLPRPAGVVFAERKKEEKRSGSGAGKGPSVVVVVDELLEGSPAHKRAAAAKLDPSLAESALLPGDVLRGFTTTNFVFRGAAGALLGVSLKPPTREVVLFGADGQSFTAVKAALQRGSSSDGDMTIVVERPG